MIMSSCDTEDWSNDDRFTIYSHREQLFEIVIGVCLFIGAEETYNILNAHF